MVSRVLMVAFHFPPLRGSSGIQRTLKFVQYLAGFGWQPLVLSAHARAYEDVGTDQLDDIPAGTPVQRAFALDTARHLAWRGRYLRLLALPDRWASWCLGALPAGLRLVRRHRPAVIWSTYPVASAHVIGLLLHRLTGLPWIADLRDPMVDDVVPEDPAMRRAYGWIERQVMRHAAAIVCTTPGTVLTYTERYPAVPRERFHLIENAYDEENFTEAATLAQGAAPGGPLLLLHSGVIYPSERDPAMLFAALAALRDSGAIDAGTLKLRLRATGHDDYLAGLAARYDVGELVELAPRLPYRAALAEMLGADALLVLQAANCNRQVPAKLYEYLRACRPVLALTDPAGDTATTLRQAGIDTIAPLDDAAAIMAALARFVGLVRRGAAPLARPDAVARHSRQARTAQLAALMDSVALRHGKPQHIIQEETR